MAFYFNFPIFIEGFFFIANYFLFSYPKLVFLVHAQDWLYRNSQLLHEIDFHSKTLIDFEMELSRNMINVTTENR